MDKATKIVGAVSAVSLLTGLVILATKSGGGGNQTGAKYILKLKNPPSVDGRWQCFIADASYPTTGWKIVNFVEIYGDQYGGYLPLDLTVEGSVPAGWQSPGKLVVWVFKWNDDHSALIQIGGREALSPEMANSVTIYDPGFVIPPGSYEIDYLTGEIIGVEG
ncbi:MAG: hypothetical protein PHD09_03895 [Candidatus Omnitrophica bacterium]|jgi:hypothetical protein|nr:hypothetical protein [Candidatus Omnitrophota bacterium]